MPASKDDAVVLDTPAAHSARGNSGPAIDPSINVQNLLLAAVKGMEGQIAAETRRVDEIRSAEIRRLDDLRAAESRRVDEQAAMREAHATDLREAEAKRIDAIRAVDVAAVGVATSGQQAQANVLAAQVAASAEVARQLVATTAAATNQQFQQTTGQLIERISALEKSGNVIAGRDTRDDPALAQLAADTRALLAAQSTGAGRSTGANNLWVIFLGALGAAGIVYGVLQSIPR